MVYAVADDLIQKSKMMNKTTLTQMSFTLIELLVVISIIMLSTAFILPHYRAGGRQFILQRSAHKLAQDIRRAQEMAMSAKEFEEKVPKGGYGIHFDRKIISGTASYDVFLYADTDSPWGRYNPGDQITETISLEKGGKIQGVEVDGSSPDKTSINFKPPDPTVSFHPSGSKVVIRVSLEADLTQTKIIKVNRVGLIYVE